MHAPNLAGLDSAYLVRQLRNFRGGLRGNVEDSNGYMMIGRASALPGDRGVRDVVAYISNLPQFDAPSTITGDVQNGQRLYQSCATCHGSRGEGNERLGAPRIAQLADQYLVTQLENFYAGVRGGVSGDLHGQQMRAATQILSDRAAINDVVAYIKSL
jgi:cytochrome c oxidase subunit 2